MAEQWAYIVQVSGPMLQGMWVTLQLFFIVIVLSIPLGLGVTYLAMSRAGFVRKLTTGYIWVIRGTPLLLQLFFIFYGLPFVPVIGPLLTFDRFTAAVVAFVVNYAAYFAEIFRGGLLAVDRSQHEAAKVLGLTKLQTARRIVIPQMIKVALPAVCNESVTLVKDTALVYAIGLQELLHFTKAAVNRDFNIMPYAVSAVFYLVMTICVTNLFRWLEKRFMFE